MRLFVGLDVSSFDMKGCILDQEGSKVDTFTVSNDLPGATVLKERILGLAKGRKVESVKIGLESTSVYSFHPSMFLHYDEDLKVFDTQVFVINPKQIANFKKSYSDMNKTDEIDAFVIADYVRFGRNQMSIVKESQYVALQQLTRSRYHLVKMMTKEKQHFLQHLNFKCSNFSHEVDSSAFGNAMMDLFLERYSLEELAQMPLDELAAFLQEHGKNRFSDPDKVATSIQRAVRSSYRLDKVVEDSMDLLLGTSIELIRSFQKQIKEIDKAITRLMTGLSQTLETIPGIGPVYAAGIIAEIGRLNVLKMKARLPNMQVYTGGNTSLAALQLKTLLFRDKETNICATTSLKPPTRLGDRFPNIASFTKRNVLKFQNINTNVPSS